MFERITSDPRVMGGRACIRGMRITVAHVVNLVANGMPVDEIVREYPDLEHEDIRQALQYAVIPRTTCSSPAPPKGARPTWCRATRDSLAPLNPGRTGC